MSEARFIAVYIMFSFDVAWVSSYDGKNYRQFDTFYIDDLPWYRDVCDLVSVKQLLTGQEP